jgi:Phenylalanyl-tRNA synthetase beta subunit
MKVSLSWVFEHIKNAPSSLENFAIDDLVTRLSAITAEVEGVQKITYNFDDFILARVTSMHDDTVIMESGEGGFWGKKITLPARAAAAGKDMYVGSFYLVKKDQEGYRYATTLDLHSEKEGSLPAIYCTDAQFAGAWKQELNTVDYILTFDNKSLTHRPDLWGFSGFAREIAAILGMQLIPEEELFANTPILHYTEVSVPASGNSITLEIADPSYCKRLAAIEITSIEPRPSDLAMALRLARIDARPIDFIVDCTNYVMYDIGQPMHAFDAAKMSGKKLIARRAHENEKLTLLDREAIILTEQDGIVADNEKPLALAGIMGGIGSSVSVTTRALVVESANFDATVIRLSAARHKRRTEASARFEKSLDPHQNTQAIARFLKVLERSEVSFTAAAAIISVGPLSPEKNVTITHAFITQRIGVAVTPERVVDILTKLGFGIRVQGTGQDVSYFIIIPTFRATKDVTIKEDILEEVARYIGYNAIPLQMPTRQIHQIDTHAVQATRTLKDICAYGLGMHEVSNYAVYDEAWLSELGFTPGATITIKNPVSENWQRMATSLVPHVLKNVAQNISKESQLRFFELNKIWPNKTEQLSCAAVWFAYKSEIDFYAAKADVQKICAALEVPVLWRKPQGVLAPWFNVHQTAELICDGRVIGVAGKLSPVLIANVAQGDGFAVEFDADWLLQYRSAQKVFMPLPKYQTVTQDISMLVPLGIAVDQIEAAIVQADVRIIDVALRDFFEKEEWGAQRAITFRYVVADEFKTLTKEEIDDVWTQVGAAVTLLGAQVR